jgi:hypothetical protein
LNPYTSVAQQYGHRAVVSYVTLLLLAACNMNPCKTRYVSGSPSPAGDTVRISRRHSLGQRRDRARARTRMGWQSRVSEAEPLAGTANSLSSRTRTSSRPARDEEQILVRNLDGTAVTATVPSHDRIREGPIERRVSLRCTLQVRPNSDDRPESLDEKDERSPLDSMRVRRTCGESSRASSLGCRRAHAHVPRLPTAAEARRPAQVAEGKEREGRRIPRRCLQA